MMADEQLTSDFGTLRALMQQKTLSPREREQLLALIMKASSHNPALYQHQWLPYLQSFTQHWSTPLGSTSSLDELQKLPQIAPFASFHLTLRTKQLKTDSLLHAFLDQIKPANVRSLFVEHSLAQDSLDLLATHPGIAHLEHLSIKNQRYPYNGLLKLLQEQQLSQLKTLSLERVSLGGDAAVAFAKIQFTKLTTLGLGHTHLASNDNTPVLCKGKCFARLKHLNLSFNHFQPHIDFDLSSCGMVNTLKSLNLQYCSSLRNPACLGRLLNPLRKSPLENLNLRETYIAQPGATLLQRTGLFSSLRALNLRDCSLGDAGLLTLLASKTPSQVAYLNLRNNSLTDKSAFALANSIHVCALQSLALGGNRVSLAGYQALAKSRLLPEEIRQQFEKQVHRITGR